MQNFIVSIYPSPGGTFFTSYTHPISKKRYREYFKSKSEAEAYKNEIEEKFKRGRIKNYQDLYVEDLVILYMQEYPKTPFSKMRRYTNDFTETFSQFKIEELTSGVLKTWLDQIQREGNLKLVTMKGIKSDMDVFFRFLIAKDVISESPLAPIYYQREVPEVSARNILSKNQINDILESAKAFSPGYLYPLLKMFEETAAKTSEVMDLTWQSLNFETKEIHFPGSIKSQSRILKISNELISILEKRKKMSGFVFMTYYKEQFTKTKLARLTNEFKIKTNCKDQWTLMDLRHSYAVNYLRSGGDIRKLQYVLGHNNVYDTKRLYVEASSISDTHSIDINPFEMGS